LRQKLGRRHPLIINHKPVSTPEWLPSLNPANQKEVIGCAAQATVAEAGSALAAAAHAQRQWARRPAPERAAILEETARLMRRDKAEMVCGNLYLNRAITGDIVGRQPFGGFRMSGAGTKAGGREYLQHFLAPQVVTENCLRRGFAPVEEA